MIPVLITPYLLGRRVELRLTPSPALLDPREIGVVVGIRLAKARQLTLAHATAATYDTKLGAWRRCAGCEVWTRLHAEIERVLVLDDVDAADGALTFRALERTFPSPSTEDDPSL